MRATHALLIGLLIGVLAACKDEASTSNNGATPGADDPVISVILTMEPNESVIFIDSEVQFAWSAVTRSGQRFNNLAGRLSVPSELSVVDANAYRYRASTIGQFEASITLDSPFDGITSNLLFEVTDQSPSVRVDYPQRGETIIAGTAGFEVLGRTTATSALTINGQAVPIDSSGSFRFPMTPEWGLNLLDVAASGAGQVAKSTPSFLYAAAYEPMARQENAGVLVTDAILGAIAEGFFDDGIHDHNNIDDLATVVEVILEDSDLAAAIEESEILDDLATQRDLGVILGSQTTLLVETNIVSPTSVGPTEISLDTIAGGILFSGRLGDDNTPALTIRLRVDLTFQFVAADGRMGRATGAIYPTIRVGSGQIDGVVRIDKRPGMPPSAQIEGFVLRADDIETDPLENVELEFDFLGNQDTVDLSSIISLDTFSEEIIDPIVNTLVGFLSDIIEPIVEDRAGELMLLIFDEFNLSDVLEIENFFDASRPPIEIQYETEINQFIFSDDGVTLGMNFGVYTTPAIPRNNDGSILRTDCLVNRPTNFNNDWSHDLTIAVQTDAMNGLLHGIWQSGMLSGPLNLSDALGDSSVFAGSDLMVVLDPHAPPIVAACKNEEGTTIQVGDLKVELGGQLLNLQMDSTIYVDLEMRAVYRADMDGISLEIGEVLKFDVEIIEVGPAANEEMLRPFLQEQLPVLINGLLVGEGVGPVSLPSFDIGNAIESLTTTDTLDFVPDDVTSRDGYILLEGNLD